MKVSLTLDLSRSNHIKLWYKWDIWETPANSRSICLLGLQVADGSCWQKQTGTKLQQLGQTQEKAEADGWTWDPLLSLSKALAVIGAVIDSAWEQNHRIGWKRPLRSLGPTTSLVLPSPLSLLMCRCHEHIQKTFVLVPPYHCFPLIWEKRYQKDQEIKFSRMRVGSFIIHFFPTKKKKKLLLSMQS